MRRMPLISLAILASVIALSAALLASPVARRLAGDVAERKGAAIIGGEIDIGAVTGDLFGRLQLRDVRLSEESVEWAAIETVEIHWSPRELLRRKIDIRTIELTNARLIATPPKRDPRPFKGLELPERLPHLSIGEIKIRNLSVDAAIAGNPVNLNAEGAVAMGGDALMITASIKSDDGRDDARLLVKRDAASNDVVIDARVVSAADGVIAALTRSGGAIDLAAQGAGVLGAYTVTFGGLAGDLGSIRGEARSDLERLEEIAFEVAFKPGARLEAQRTTIGELAALSGVFHREARGGRLAIDNLDVAAGGLKGFMQWTNSGSALAAASGALTARFAGGWRPDLQAAIGDAVTIEFTLERNGKSINLAAKGKTPLLAFAIEEGRTDLQTKASGKAVVRIDDDSSLARPLKSEVRASADAGITRDGVVRLQGVDLRTASGVRVAGDFSFDRGARSIDAAASLTATSEALSAYFPAMRSRGNLTADVSVKGAAEDFTLRATGTTPALAVNDNVLAPIRWAASFVGSPSAPAGEISLRALDGTMRSVANVARTPDGFWRLSNLDHRGRGYALRGAASFNHETWEGAVDLKYKGAEGAEPFPGYILEEEAEASGVISRARADNRLAVTVASLRTKNWSARALRLAASGPISNLAYTFSADALDASGRVLIEDVQLSGAAALDSGPSIAIAEGAAKYEGQHVRLAKTATVKAGDGIELDNFSLRVGDWGAAHAEGAFSRRRWRATATVSDLDLPGGATTADLSVTLDTAATPAAAGRFNLDSQLTRSAALGVPGDFTWNGRTLTVRASGVDGALDLNLSLPLVLTRGSRLGVRLDGALAGDAQYAGLAQSIAIFLPTPLQTLEGALKFSGSLGGTVRNPRLEGTLRLEDGAYTELASGVSVVDIDLEASAERTAAASVIRFSGSAAGAGQPAKTILATGEIDLKDGATVAAAIKLDRARFSSGPVARIDASGSINLSGTPEDIFVAGDVEIHELDAELFTPPDIGLVDIDVVAVDENGKPAPLTGPPRRAASAVRYRIGVTADDNVFVRGRGLDSEWRANAQITGEGARPLALGVLNLRRGDLEFSGRRFNITRGSIAFDTLAPNDPTIDIRAERRTGEGVTVAVVITGRSSALQVSLESSPSLANEDVMALILFDKPADELSAFESLQVADSLTQLGGVGVFGGKGVAGAARDALGLDLLNLEIDEADSSGSLLTVGKYVTDGLFISASQNARGENGSLRIEYEIGDSFSVETELRQDGDQTVSANWKKDF